MRPSPLVMALALACGGSLHESQSDGDDESSSGSGSSTSGGDSTSTTGDVGDPEYPRPDPIDAAGMCPPESFGPITFDGAAWICIPQCGADDSCPAPTTGTADAACATNPYSSATPCVTSGDCTVDGEMCGNAGAGMQACLLPPTHCILRCDGEHACPDEMVCTIASVCAYPP